ncbi:Alpha/Beta hydrolase protein [Chytridium lagenaria]|nr:Alpha/Beta hydrolase protein [Chytridium lagenaria]
MALTLAVAAGVATIGVAGLYNAVVPSRTGTLQSLSAVAPKLREAYPEDYWKPYFKASLTHGKTHYSLQGPENGVKIVLVHGLVGVWGCMPDFVNGLVGRGYRVLLYDTYGRGYSDAPGATYDHKLYSQQLKELLDEVQWMDAVNVLGYSLGGAIATAFAAVYPERVENLLLVAPSGLKTTLPALGVIVSVPVFGELFAHAVGRRVMASTVGKALQPESKERMTQAISVAKSIILYHPGFMRALVSTVREGPIRNMEPLYKKNAEVLGDRILCVWGTDDPVCDYKTEFPKFKEDNPKAKIVVLEGMNHELVPEAPEAVLTPVHEFLTSRRK